MDKYFGGIIDQCPFGNLVGHLQLLIAIGRVRILRGDY